MSRNERRLRLGSGLVIAAWVAMHLSNHAFGILSLDAMERVRHVNAALWQSVPGTIALYGALATHVGLALVSLYRRRTLRMPAWEAAQLALGLAVPPLLALHVIGTRVSRELLGIDITYPYVVTILWNDDWYRVKQTLLVVVVWVHLAIGVHFWLRLRRWYPRALPALYALAIVLPLLALLGFARAGLDSERIAASPVAMAMVMDGWNRAPEDARRFVQSLHATVQWTLAALLASVLVARAVRSWRAHRRGGWRVRLGDGQSVGGEPGQTVLEALRAAGVAHASVCGGRARCTTCRVLVTEGLDRLAPPRPLEARALARVRAAPNVRLACQTRPRADLAVTPLVAPDAGLGAARRPGGVAGREQSVVIVFVDLRESTRFAADRLPYDVVWILNEFFAELSAALAATGGHYAQFSGDGLMALYGLRSGLDRGSREALHGAAEMTRRVDALAERLSGELEAPLRLGIGIHGGEAIVGTMGPPDAPNFSAVGDNVNIAARLEGLTKKFGCTLVVSAETAARAGVDLGGWPRRSVRVRGRAGALDVVPVEDPLALERLLEGAAAGPSDARPA